jgi:hypothetical protein
VYLKASSSSPDEMRLKAYPVGARTAWLWTSGKEQLLEQSHPPQALEPDLCPLPMINSRALVPTGVPSQGEASMAWAELPWAGC